MAMLGQTVAMLGQTVATLERRLEEFQSNKSISAPISFSKALYFSLSVSFVELLGYRQVSTPVSVVVQWLRTKTHAHISRRRASISFRLVNPFTKSHAVGLNPEPHGWEADFLSFSHALITMIILIAIISCDSQIHFFSARFAVKHI